MTYALIAALMLLLYLAARAGWWHRLRGRRQRVLRVVIARKEGYIRPNVLLGGGGYRVLVTEKGQTLDVMVADHAVYEQLREGSTMRLAVSADPRGQWWLVQARPD